MMNFRGRKKELDILQKKYDSELGRTCIDSEVILSAVNEQMLT